MPMKICVLAPWEADSLKDGVAPCCGNHEHVSALEAAEITGRGERAWRYRENGRPEPIARWLSRRRVVLVKAWEWRVKKSDCYLVNQLVEI